MIDCEDEIFSIVAKTVRAEFPGIYMTGNYERSPAKFPCVSLMERNNAVWRNSRDSSEIERAAAVMYEVNIFSNLKNGRKRECKAIAAVVDKVMGEIGFTRTMLNPLPNQADATIYRITGRYQAIIGKDDFGQFVVYKR